MRPGGEPERSEAMDDLCSTCMGDECDCSESDSDDSMEYSEDQGELTWLDDSDEESAYEFDDDEGYFVSTDE